jgi:tryptophan synthase alpha chain
MREKMTETIKLSGVETIAGMFAAAEADRRAAFLPYFPIGYPTYDESIDAIDAMASVGVDGFEIGISFSDPLADGPVIQAATQIALENGTTVKSAIEAVKALRGRGVTQPMLMMSYINPLIAYGTEEFVVDAKAAGADGLIVPDLPPEEAHWFTEICEREGMALVFFLAPTSNPARIKLVGERSTGFIYVAALTGITGERSQLPTDLTEFSSRSCAGRCGTRTAVWGASPSPSMTRCSTRSRRSAAAMAAARSACWRPRSTWRAATAARRPGWSAPT